MSYSKVTSANIIYQPRENIITLLKSNFTNKDVSIYTIFPDMTRRDFNGFPFILIPEIPITESGRNLKNNIQYSNQLSGTIYHDRELLGDNKVRTIKQDLLTTLTKRANAKVLDLYGVSDVKVEYDGSDFIAELQQGKRIVGFEFTISFQLDVDMDM